MTESYNHFQELANALPKALGKIVRNTSDAAVTNIQSWIVANGQIDTGYMFDSVYESTTEGSTYVSGVDALPEIPKPTKETEAYVAVAANYGYFQNYGTSALPARPFFEPGLDETMPDFERELSLLEDELRDAIR